MISKLLIIASVATMGLARCPNDCSGKGSCGEHDLCSCYPGYQALDCSERTCLSGRAWGDVADGNDQAHDYTECSSNGVCDRKTGECTCNDGFTGDACRYTSCPNGCSGHGTCEYISEMATDGSIQFGAPTDREYDLWDAKKSRMCKCDGYWSGPDCSERMCPKGNDPLTTMTEDKIGGNTNEVQEVQTINIRPQLTANGDGSYVGLGGDFTLSYTDAYNQEWTTRPIRVATHISQTRVADASTNADGTVVKAYVSGELVIVNSGSNQNKISTITDTQRRFNMFELYDSIKVHGAGYNSGTAAVTTITDIDCTYVLALNGASSASACTAILMPQIPALSAAATEILITLVSSDTGEIGVKRMLQELPNQVIPSITVDETIALASNTYKVTFSDSANSGDQHMLSCKVGACDTDGCQPRKKAIKGLFRQVVTGATPTTTALKYGAVAGMTSNFNAGTVEIILQSNGAKARSAVVTAVSSTELTLGAAYIEALGDNPITVYQTHDFTDDSIGANTGGVDNNVAVSSLAREKTMFSVTATFVVGATGLNKFTATLSSALQGMQAVGDTVSIACTGVTGGDVNDGYYKVSKVEGTGLTLEGHMTAFATGSNTCVVKKVVASPCTVTETQKGTSELATCSRHGNCDSQTGLCACFSGYVGEDCATQTVLV